MSNRPRDNLLDFLRKYHEPVKLHGQSFYALNAKAILYFRYSKRHGSNTYFFGVEADDLARFETQNTYLLFMCGDETKVIVLPVGQFSLMVRGTDPVSTQWKILIREQNGKWLLRVARKGQFEVTDFLNFFDFTPSELSRTKVPTVGEFIPVGRRVILRIPPPADVKASKELTELLLESAVDSMNPSYLERNVSQAFAELGLATQGLGQPGETDILITSPFRAIVDCKSTAGGSLSQVYFTRIKHHMKDHKADHAVIVCVKFDPAVIRDAIEENVALLEVSKLVELLNLNRRFPVSPDLLKPLFQTAGRINEEAVESIRSISNEAQNRITRAAHILEALDFTERTPQEIRGRLEGRGRGDFSLTEIVSSLTFFSLPILDVATQTPTGYSLKLSLPQARSRISAVFSGFTQESS